MATKCFIAMPISTPDPWAKQLNDNEHFYHVLEYLFKPALAKGGYDAVSPISTGSELIHAEIIRNLEVCDLVLCDISALNPNVFFELGIRTSLNKPVVMVKDNLTPSIPFDTGSINTYTYDANLQAWSIGAEIAKLAEHISTSEEKSQGSNPLWRYFGLKQLAEPAQIDNPEEAKLDLLIAELSELRRMVSSTLSNTLINIPLAGQGLGSSYFPDGITYYGMDATPMLTGSYGMIGSTPIALTSSSSGSIPSLSPIDEASREQQDFAKQAKAIAAPEGAVLVIDGCDPTTGKVILNCQKWPISAQALRRIAEVGLNLNVGYELRP